MRARDVMTSGVISVAPETSVTDAARLMLDRRISGVPVLDQAGGLVGILTEGDLMRRAELVTEDGHGGRRLPPRRRTGPAPTSRHTGSRSTT